MITKGYDYFNGCLWLIHECWFHIWCRIIFEESLTWSFVVIKWSYVVLTLFGLGLLVISQSCLTFMNIFEIIRYSSSKWQFVRLSYPLQNRGKGKQRRTKFTEAEDNAILQGVNKFGMGRWTKTLETYWYVFQTNQRSAVNLKDRYRCLVNRK